MDRTKLTPEQDGMTRDALHVALEAGAGLLRTGGSALDAVEAAVIALENDPHFNAGRGAVLTYEGGISLDAAIMDGQSRNAGAIAGTTVARNPVRAARRVMEASPHVMLSGPGADEFVTEEQLDLADQAYFETAERRRQPTARRRGKISRREAASVVLRGISQEAVSSPARSAL